MLPCPLCIPFHSSCWQQRRWYTYHRQCPTHLMQSHLTLFIRGEVTGTSSTRAMTDALFLLRCMTFSVTFSQANDCMFRRSSLNDAGLPSTMTSLVMRVRCSPWKAILCSLENFLTLAGYRFHVEAMRVRRMMLVWECPICFRFRFDCQQKAGVGKTYPHTSCIITGWWLSIRIFKQMCNKNLMRF